MPHLIDHLSVPPIGISTSDAHDRKLQLALEVPASSNVKDEIPFLEVTRITQKILFNGARQDVISSLGSMGYQIGEVGYKTGSGDKSHAGEHAGTSLYGSQALFFDVSLDANASGRDRATGTTDHLRIAIAITAAENNFQSRRLDLYESYANQWYRNGGASLVNDGEMYEVTRNAAKGYLDDYAKYEVRKRAEFEDGRSAPLSGMPLLSDDERINLHFAQALRGSGGDRDAAAAAVNTISQAPGYKPDQDISVTQGKSGLIVSQGQGDAALNLQVPQAKQGDFEKIATQMAQPQQAQQIAMRQEEVQQERRGPAV
jgi:hypothetical protein